MTTTVRARIAALAVATLVGGALVPLSMSGASAETAPAPVRLPAPTGQSTLVESPKNIVLSWAGVRGATGYRVQVGTDDQWSDTPTFAKDTQATRLELPTWLPHASYYWRVASLSGGTAGRWTATTDSTGFTRAWELGRPAPLTPAASETPVVGRPTFSWTPVETASAYQLQISTSPTFNEDGLPTTAPTTDNAPTQDQQQPAVDTCYTARTRVTPFTGQATHNEDNPGACVFTTLGDPTTPVYWRVRALDRFVGAAEDTDTTPASTEGISHLPPSSEPDNANLVSSCPTPPAAAGSSPTPSAASPSASASSSASPSASPAAAAGESTLPTTCELSHAAEKGPWSASTRFFAGYPRLLADDSGRYRSLAVDAGGRLRDLPADLCDVTTRTCRDFPTIRWDAVPGADRYRVYVALDSSYSNIQRIVETSGTEWTPTDAWRDSKAGQAYYYVVQPCTMTGTQAGCGMVTSTPPSFRKVSTATQATAPADGAVLKGGGVTFSWADWAGTQGATSGAFCATASATSACPGESYAYRVQVATADNADFQPDGLIDDATVDGTSYTAPDKVYADGELLWRVQALDSSAHGMRWSTPRSLRLDATAPTAVVAPGANVAVRGALRITFSEAVRGVSASSVTIPGASVVVGNVTPTSATVTPSTTLVPGASYDVSFGSAITDLAGNPLATTARPIKVNALADDRSPALAYAGSWRTMASTNAVSGGFHGSAPVSRYPTTAAVTAYGSGVLLTGCMGPANGVVKVYVDGVLRATKDTYRAFSGCGLRLIRVTGLTAKAHRVQIRATGLRSTASRGTLVGVDAVTALP